MLINSNVDLVFSQISRISNGNIRNLVFPEIETCRYLSSLWERQWARERKL